MRRHISAPRLIEIDSLRGIAAFWVVIFHFSFGVGYWLKDDPVRAAMVAPFNWNMEGLLAVDMFFMISGFVILMTIEKSRSVADFVIARFARLYPAYWACLAMTAAVIEMIPEPAQSISAGQIAANLTMLNLYFRSQPVEAVYWSLAIELGFYAMMATIFAVNQLHNLERLGTVWIVLSLLLLKIFPQVGAVVPWRIQAATALPWAPLFFGGILVYRIRHEGPTTIRIGLLAACLIIRAAGAPLVYTVGTAVIFALFSLAATGRATFLRLRPLQYLGAISYPLYLVHQSIGFRIQDTVVMRLGLSAIDGFVIAIASVVVLSTAVTFTVERRGQRLIRQAFKNRLDRKSLTHAPQWPWWRSKELTPPPE
jgi:peptidoglycan/LPS O-acetylase OafA/YrhL